MGLASPSAIVAEASERATVLMKIVESKKLYQTFSGKKYLEAEAWQTILAFDNACFSTDNVTPITDAEGVRVGYTAKVSILKRGEVVASGIMSCGFDEFPCRGKQGMAKDRAAMSAAQTWAGSKAARMRYAWVAVLAGYEPTPSSEVEEGHQTAPEGQQAPRPAQTTRRAPAAPSAKPAGTADKSAALVAATDDFYKATSDWTNEDRTAFIFSNFAAKWAELSVEQRRKAIGLISTLPTPDSGEAR